MASNIPERKWVLWYDEHHGEDMEVVSPFSPRADCTVFDRSALMCRKTSSNAVCASRRCTHLMNSALHGASSQTARRRSPKARTFAFSVRAFAQSYRTWPIPEVKIPYIALSIIDRMTRLSVACHRSRADPLWTAPSKSVEPPYLF